MIKKIVVLISIMLILTGCEKKPENNVSPRASEKENVTEILEDEKETTENNTKKYEPKIPVDYLYAIEKFEKIEEEFEENRSDNEERANYDNIYIEKKIVVKKNLLGDLEIPFNVTITCVDDKVLYIKGISEKSRCDFILYSEGKREFFLFKDWEESDSEKYIINDGNVFLVDDDTEELISQNEEKSKKINTVISLFKENEEKYEYVFGYKFYPEFSHPKSKSHPSSDIYFIALDNKSNIIMKEQIWSGMAGGIYISEEDDVFNKEIENPEGIINKYQNYYSGVGFAFAIWRDTVSQEVRLYGRIVFEGIPEEDFDHERKKSFLMKKYYFNKDGELESETIKNGNFVYRMFILTKEDIIEVFGKGSYNGAFDYYTRYYAQELGMDIVHLAEEDGVGALKLKDVSEIEFLKGYKKGMTYDEIAEEFKEYEPAKMRDVYIFDEHIGYGLAWYQENYQIIIYGDDENMPGDWVYFYAERY